MQFFNTAEGKCDHLSEEVLLQTLSELRRNISPPQETARKTDGRISTCVLLHFK